MSFLKLFLYFQIYEGLFQLSLAQDVGRDDYSFHLLADDNARLWIDGDLIIDTWDCADTRFPYRAHSVYGIVTAPTTFDELPPCNETTGVVPMTGGHYHDIRVEYRELRGRASIRLGWSSAIDQAAVEKQVVALAPNKRVTVRKWNDATLVDIREYYQIGGEGPYKPGKKGISLSVEQWSKTLSKRR